jgi:hypothetical protein
VRIGVVSDTHNHLPNVRRIVQLFEAARVERVVHTGDITQAKTLDVLAKLSAPVVGVYGNNDLERDALEAAAARHGFHFTDPPLRLEWAGRRVVVVHDPRALAREGDFALALHGHTHRRTVDRAGNRLVFNPGECAGHLRGHNAVGVVDLATLAVELLRF